jgi:autotransporter passenger strand-loop-strand repeat protein
MTVLAGGEQEVAGSASDTVLAGGLQQIDAGGGAIATTIEDGGKQYVDRGATARNSTIETGGAEYVVAGATIGTIIDGGTESVRGLPSGGVIGGTYIVGTAQQTLINSGTENVGAGGNAIATTIGSSTLEVARDGALSSLQLPALPPLRTQTYLPSVTFAAGGDGTLKLDASAQLLAPEQLWHHGG